MFQQRAYSFLTSNCHSFVAHALNAAAYDGSTGWNAVNLTLCMLRRGRAVGLAGFAKQWGPFAIVMALGLYALGWLFLWIWLACFALAAGWFVGHARLSKSSGEQDPAPGTLHNAYSV